MKLFKIQTEILKNIEKGFNNSKKRDQIIFVENSENNLAIVFNGVLVYFMPKLCNYIDYNHAIHDAYLSLKDGDQGNQFYKTLTAFNNEFEIKFTGNKKALDTKKTALEFADANNNFYYCDESLLKNFDLSEDSRFYTSGKKQPIKIYEDFHNDISGLVLPLNIL